MKKALLKQTIIIYSSLKIMSWTIKIKKAPPIGKMEKIFQGRVSKTIGMAISDKKLEKCLKLITKRELF